MRKLFVFIIFLLMATVVMGAPARNIIVSYASQDQKLSIKADHPTDRPDRNFIRMVVVKSDKQEDKTFTYPRQASPTSFTATLDYTAVPGESLEILLYSSEGGLAQADLEIPKEDTATNTDNSNG